MGIVGFLPKDIIPGKSGQSRFHRANAHVASPAGQTSIANRRASNAEG
jgi:hypothetical protein